MISLLSYTLLAFVSVNRASFLMGLGLSMFYFVYILFNTSSPTKIIVYLLFLITLIALAIFFRETIIDTDFFARLSDRKLETGRFSIWQWYLNKITIQDFLIGSNVDETQKSISLLFFPYAPEDTHTLHNIFLNMFMQIGISGVIFILILFNRLRKLINFGKQKIIILGVLVLVFIKSQVDITMLPGYMDWVFFLLFFYSFTKPKKLVRTA
jgi:hypothetical protein